MVSLRANLEYVLMNMKRFEQILSEIFNKIYRISCKIYIHISANQVLFGHIISNCIYLALF